MQQFVQLALANDTANITSLQNQQTTLGAQTTALQQITTDLNNLQSAAFALSDPLGALGALTTSSSNTSVVSATAASTAEAGTHTVTVNSPATTSSYYTNPVATSSTPLASGTFQIQVGSKTPVSVTIDSSDNTLNGLAAAINDLGAGVQANVINDANGARLSLVSSTTGAPGDLTVSGNTTGLTFNKAVTGSNASLTVDGVPLSSTSNVISGAIDGVTLNLGSASVGSPVSITIAPDTTQAANAVNSFVSSYNAALKDINAQFAVASDGSGGGPLESDGSLREAQAALLAAVSFSAPGNGGAVNLASIGVNLNDDGSLSVDASALSSSLASNFSGVQSFLQNSTTGFANNLSNAITNLTDPSTGALSLDAQGISQSSSALGDQISDLQAALAVKQQNLTQVYAQVNETLQELPLLQSQLSQQLATI
ncbi:MAG TPA: flagellar filament capping protein FliD [Pirellulales bacterium]|nr:flagellar filament capping protein FliD [Pirellulales bacterium]